MTNYFQTKFGTLKRKLHDGKITRAYQNYLNKNNIPVEKVLTKVGDKYYVTEDIVTKKGNYRKSFEKKQSQNLFSHLPNIVDTPLRKAAAQPKTVYVSFNYHFDVKEVQNNNKCYRRSGTYFTEVVMTHFSDIVDYIISLIQDSMVNGSWEEILPHSHWTKMFSNVKVIPESVYEHSNPVQNPDQFIGYMMDYKMRRANVIDFKKWLGVSESSKMSINDGWCVIDLLLERYTPHIKRLTKENLIETLFDGRPYISETGLTELSAARLFTVLPFSFYEPLNPSSFTDDKEISQGISTFQIIQFAKKYQIRIIAMDFNDEIFYKSDYVCSSKNYPCLYYYACDDHMYLVDDISQIKRISEKAKIVTNGHIIERETKSKNEPIYKENLSYDDLKQLLKDSDNNYIVQYDEAHLDKYFDSFISDNIVANTKINSHRQIVELYFDNIVLRADPNIIDTHKLVNFRNVREACEKADIKFTNQNITGFSMQVLNQLNNKKADRKPLSESEKAEICMLYDHICNYCEKDLKENSKKCFDHIVPLCQGGADDISNIQLLCSECHHDKTQDERDTQLYVKYDKTTSHFNQNVRELFEGEFMNNWAFVQQLEDANKDLDDLSVGFIDKSKKYALDTRGMRRNILENLQYDIPTYNVMDEVETFDGTLKAGFYYVATDNLFPFRGNKFYPNALVEYGLSEGIITKNQIKYQLISKAGKCCEKGYFKEFIGMLKQYIPNMQHVKMAVNNFIGCTGKKQNAKSFQTMKVTRSHKDAVLAHSYYKSKVHYYGKNYNVQNEYYRIYDEKKIVDNSTRLPIYLYILGMEAMELHKLYKLVKANNGIPTYVNTDAVYFKMNEENFKNMGFEQYQWANGEQKYKREKVKKTRYAERMKNVKCETKFVPSSKTYNVVTENDKTTDELVDIITKMGSCCLLGPAGTGKSTLVNKLKQNLNLNAEQIKVLTPTNKASLIVKGKTIDKFINETFSCRSSYNKLQKVKYIFIDEISMLRSDFYNILLNIKQDFPHLNFILSGDFNQLKPVKDIYNYNYKQSEALFELCSGNQMRLTVCKRSDNALFDFSMKILRNADINNIVTNNKECRRSIAFTNVKRMAVNKMWNDIEAEGKDYVNFTKLSWDKNTQAYKCFVGLPVIARRMDQKNNIVNNETYTVTEISEEFITVQNSEKQEIDVERKRFHMFMQPAYCITCHKSQGETIREDYTIYEFEKMDRRGKYVAVTRGETLSQINIV